MIKSIQARRINASVAQNPYDMGYIGVEQALRAINGETVVTRIDSGVDIITTDNAKEKLEFLKTILKPRYGLLQIIQCDVLKIRTSKALLQTTCNFAQVLWAMKYFN
jgi:hypothetical protein